MANQADTSSDINRLLSLLWRRKFLIVAAAVLAGLAGYLVSSTQSSKYVATSELQLEPVLPATLLPSTGASSTNQDVHVQAELRFLGSEHVSSEAAKRLGFAPSFDYQLFANSDVVAIKATESTAQRAADAANTYAQAYIDVRGASLATELDQTSKAVQAKRDDVATQLVELLKPLDSIDQQLDAAIDTVTIQRLTRQRTDLADTIAPRRTALNDLLSRYDSQLGELSLAGTFIRQSGASIISPALPPSSRTSPKPIRDTSIALVIGALLGIGLVVLQDRMDESITTDEELIAATGGLPVLTSVAADKRRASRPVRLDVEALEAHGEPFRMLRTSLRMIHTDGPVKVFQISSARPGEGKTSVAANLAVALGHSGLRVAVVDADLRRPALHEVFGTHNGVGLSNVLSGRATVERALHKVFEVAGLYVMPAGTHLANASELLTDDALEVLKALRERFEVVILDTPPVLEVSDALALSQHTDAVIVVAAAHRTKRSDVVRMMRLLDQSDALIIGSVLNFADERAAYGGGGYRLYTPTGPHEVVNEEARATVPPVAASTLNPHSSPS